MFDLEELRDDLLIQEGHYQEHLQDEALKEAYIHHTAKEFEELTKTYGVGQMIMMLSKEAREKMFNYFFNTEDAY